MMINFKQLAMIIVTTTTLGLSFGCVDHEFKVDQPIIDVVVPIPPNCGQTECQPFHKLVTITISNDDQYSHDYKVAIGKPIIKPKTVTNSNNDESELPSWLKVESHMRATFKLTNNKYHQVLISIDAIFAESDPITAVNKTYCVPVTFTNHRGFTDTSMINILLKTKDQAAKVNDAP